MIKNVQDAVPEGLDVLVLQEVTIDTLTARQQGPKLVISVVGVVDGVTATVPVIVELRRAWLPEMVSDHFCMSLGVSPCPVQLFTDADLTSSVPTTIDGIALAGASPLYAVPQSTLPRGTIHPPARYAIGALATALGLPNVSFAVAYPEGIGSFGNAILSRAPLTVFQSIQVGSTPAIDARCPPIEDWPITRAGAVATLHCTNPGLTILGTHLDHVYEELRVHQIAELVSKLDVGAPTVLIGDLNSLCRGDYTADRWEDVAAVRRENFWEEPRTDVLDTLHAAGFVDAHQIIHPGTTPDMTCRFDTRIDYVMVRGRVQVDSFTTHPSCSDHRLLVVRVSV